MTLTIRLRPRPRAARQVCTDCESTRMLLRRQGRRSWDPGLGLCVACYRRRQQRTAARVVTGASEGSLRSIA
ncbi:MAG: hypothetical protein AB7O67_14235 [Vicinamibacterales bacterium]